MFAHPDDETFCVGGTIAKYAEQNVGIDLFCATNGDAGKSASVPVSSREELAGLRRNELLSAARLLGIDRVEMPGYDDGALDQADPKRLIAEVVTFIRRSRPTVIITFGPEGAPTGHRDHSAISRIATAAYFLSGLATSFPDGELQPFQAARLFYHAWEFPLRDPRLRLESVPATVAVDVREFNARKEAAFAAHVTQQGSAHAFRSSALNDFERLALAAGIPQPRAMIDDVFEGLP